jgi:hypothetical protein
MTRKRLPSIGAVVMVSVVMTLAPLAAASHLASGASLPHQEIAADAAHVGPLGWGP